MREQASLGRDRPLPIGRAMDCNFRPLAKTWTHRLRARGWAGESQPAQWNMTGCALAPRAPTRTQIYPEGPPHHRRQATARD